MSVNENDILNNNSADSSKKNNKILISVIMVICGIIVICIGLVLTISNRGNNSDKANTGENMTEETKSKEEILANSILDELCIDDYLRFAFTPNVVFGENLLNVGIRSNMVLFFYADNNLTKYRLNDYDTGNVYAFVKYSDYADEHRRIFGVEPDMTSDYGNSSSIVINIPNSPEIIGSDYQASTADIMSCDISNYSNCFVVLVQEHDNHGTVKFSDLSIKNNIITGNVRRNFTGDTSVAYLDGVFEFEYEKSGEKYIAKSLKITSISDSHNIFETE